MIKMLERGNVWYDIPGENATDFITNMINRIDIISKEDKQKYIDSCLEREKSSSTAMGRGIAFPHVDLNFEHKEIEPFIVLVYPQFPIDWKASDNIKVNSVFFIVARNRSEHLTVLSSLAKLCRNDKFLEALENESNLEIIGSFVKDIVIS